MLLGNEKMTSYGESVCVLEIHGWFVVCVLFILKPGLHLNANSNDVCGSEARQNVWYICTLFDIRRVIE